MKRILVLLLISLSTLLLSACVGMGNKKSNPVGIYDFGLSTEPHKLVSLVTVLDITSTEPLNSTHIRYRLNHENPSRVFNYTESRWSTTPAELLTQQLKTHTEKPKQLNCILKLELSAFDHVYETLNNSLGVVQLSATLMHKKNRTILATRTFQFQSPAPSNNAQGGVAALNQAGIETLTQVIAWSNEEAQSVGVCQ